MNAATEQSVDPEEEEEVRSKVKAAPGSQEVRHQLKKMVSGKLADRGVTTRELWSTRPRTKAKLTKEEQERLERQRLNKRKWAQKERARSKSLLDELKQANSALEYRNQQLKGHVNKLQEVNHQLRNVLTDHQCRLTAPGTFIYVPLSQKWTHRIKDKDTATNVDTSDLKHSFLQVSSDQEHLALGNERKVETVGQRSSGNFVPISQAGYIVVDKCFSGGQSSTSSQHAQHSNIYQVNSLHTVTNLTARPGLNTRVYEVHKPESSNQDAGVKLSTDHFMDTSESEPYDKSGLDGSGQSLTSGGFTVSELTGVGTSYLQMLQDDEEDVEMKGDLYAASERREKQIEDSGQHIGSEHLSMNITSQTVAAINGSEKNGLKAGLKVPSSFIKQNRLTSESEVERRHQTSDAPRNSVESVTAQSCMERTLTQPDNSEGRQERKQPEAASSRQTAGSGRVSDSPQTSHAALSKPAKHRTRKVVLMERWFAQEHKKELMKKQLKPLIPHSTKEGASRRITVNPWAVIGPVETKDSDCAVPDLLKASVSTPSDTSSQTSHKIVISRFTDTKHPVIPAFSLYQAPSSSGMGASEFNQPSTGSTAATNVVLTTNTCGIQARADSHFPAISDPPSESFAQRDDPEDPIPSLSQEGHTLTRRLSWPNDYDTQSCRRSVRRPRCLSLPSNFSDVVFEAADTDAHTFLTTEQVFSLFLNPDLGFGRLPMLAVDPNPQTLTTNSFSSEANDAPKKLLPNFCTEELPSSSSTPSAPITIFPFGTSAESVSNGREAHMILQREMKRRENSHQEAESYRVYGHWEGGETSGRNGRVKVERVPDADINTWQVMCELPLTPDPMD
ncbi:hypothetical protein ACOMHN_043602 [Nucella lapillus]